MREEGHTPITIAGYISMNLDLVGVFSPQDLQAKKVTLDPYQSVLDDMVYRLDIGEGLNYDYFSGYEDNQAFADYINQYLKNEIEADQLPIEKVQFYEYEENGSVQGYDYVATLKFEWEALWNRWNKYNQI